MYPSPKLKKERKKERKKRKKPEADTENTEIPRGFTWLALSHPALV
jgi:hypothetical protein